MLTLSRVVRNNPRPLIMSTKNYPGAFDCYYNAEPDEPLFVLLARDKAAPATILTWVSQRVNNGLNVPEDLQIEEALNCVKAMVHWRRENRFD